MNEHFTRLEIVGACFAGLTIVAALIALCCFFGNMSPMDLLRKALRFLVKAKILRRPKSKLYVVELQVRLDGKIIKQLPVEIYAYSRRHAKFGITRRLTFTTATTALRADLIKHSRNAR